MLDALLARLAPFGLNVVGAVPAARWDAHAPPSLASSLLLPGAKSAIVVGSGGPLLLRRALDARPSREDPVDDFVASALSHGDAFLRERGVRARSFEAAFRATPRLDFRALGALAGLGAVGPFGLLVHPRFGPWFALRGAWLTDVELETQAERAVCEGCARPCVGFGVDVAIERATFDMRRRCPVGVPYDDDAIAHLEAQVRS